MISKVSELLELFIHEEKEKLKEFDMPHMPTLGSAYEEITKQGIDSNFAIPKSLDLKVVSGFISIEEEMLPEQIDCMLVHGEGKRYGLTDQFIYSIDQILCIFEVKKTLGKNDFLDAFDHLRGIRTKFAEHFENKLTSGGYEPKIDVAKKHFSQLTGKAAPQRYLDIHNLPKNEGIMFYALVQESLAPLSIIHGYGGYKTEQGLRTVFADFLENQMKNGGRGFGIPSIPSLVTSNQFCLIKGNGMPFIALNKDKNWVAVLSSRSNPAKIILEFIWSKISVYFDVEMPWGADLDVESLSPLLIAIPKEDGERAGWCYRTVEFKEKILGLRPEQNQWSPYKISSVVVTAIGFMAMKGGYLTYNDSTFEYICEKHGINSDELRNQLLSTLEFMEEGDIIRPINATTYLLTEEDETGWVSSEKERFDQWCAANDIAPGYMALVVLEE
jgi:hypothetical protein